jgi:hypothetical protein
MAILLFTLGLGCADKELTYECTDEEVLQECDADGNCTDLEFCAENGLMCHAEMGHCMAMEDSGNE